MICINSHVRNRIIIMVGRVGRKHNIFPFSEQSNPEHTIGVVRKHTYFPVATQASVALHYINNTGPRARARARNGLFVCLLDSVTSPGRSRLLTAFPRRARFPSRPYLWRRPTGPERRRTESRLITHQALLGTWLICGGLSFLRRHPNTFLFSMKDRLKFSNSSERQQEQNLQNS
jgi:hypothetical protein